MMPDKSIYVTCGHLQRHIELYRESIEAAGIRVIVPPLKGQQFSETEMLSLITEADVIIAGDDPLGVRVLEAGAASKLKGVVRWGIGTDNVDLLAAAELGIPVYNTPGMFNHEVADLALGHILLLSRHLHKMDRDVREGKWTRYEGVSLSGKTAGVIGLGGIGREVARRFVAFGLDAIGFDVVKIDVGLLQSIGVRQVELDELLRSADIIVLACALTPESHHLLNSEAFLKMKRGVTVVNVARGPIIDEDALVAALRSGIVGAAGLDVFENEPLPAASQLRQFENCLFGTHSGSSTIEAIQRTNSKSVQIALGLLGIESAILTSCNKVA